MRVTASGSANTFRRLRAGRPIIYKLRWVLHREHENDDRLSLIEQIARQSPIRYPGRYLLIELL